MCLRLNLLTFFLPAYSFFISTFSLFCPFPHYVRNRFSALSSHRILVRIKMWKVLRAAHNKPNSPQRSYTGIYNVVVIASLLCFFLMFIWRHKLRESTVLIWLLHTWIASHNLHTWSRFARSSYCCCWWWFCLFSFRLNRLYSQQQQQQQLFSSSFRPHLLLLNNNSCVCSLKFYCFISTPFLGQTKKKTV